MNYQFIMNIYGTFERPLFLADEVAAAIGLENISNTIMMADENERVDILIQGNSARVYVALTDFGLCRLSIDYPGPRSRAFIGWAAMNVIRPLRQMVAPIEPEFRLPSSVKKLESTEESIDDKYVDSKYVDSKYVDTKYVDSKYVEAQVIGEPNDSSEDGISFDQMLSARMQEVASR